ncbi:MAG: hypothetical protein K0S18_94 [Anaerocolumna sp.]|jgi:hypothetical protein|nr:hypothetical protein [Anaerocolumna sp.]
MKYYYSEDLINIIMICNQDESDINNIVAQSLIKRCEKAMACSDIKIRFTKRDRDFLLDKMWKDIDENARFTIMRIMGV